MHPPIKSVISKRHSQRGLKEQVVYLPFSVRVTASDSTVKCHDGGEAPLIFCLSLNIKMADKEKEMNLHQS